MKPSGDNYLLQKFKRGQTRFYENVSDLFSIPFREKFDLGRGAMKLPTLFIRNTREFEESRQEIEKTLTNECLPGRVFHRDFRWFAFEEFDWAMSGAFWPIMQELAQASGDISLLMAVLDPEPEGYFKKEFGYYNWVNIPISASRDDYWELLSDHPESSPADSFLANSEKVIWLPRSAKWAI